MQDNLDDLLKKRTVPELHSDLAERIVAAAEPSGGKYFFAFFQWVRPVHLMVLSVLLLLVTGVYMNDLEPTNVSDAPMDEIAMYMVYESLETSDLSML